MTVDRLLSPADPAVGCGVDRLRAGTAVLILGDADGPTALVPADTWPRARWGPEGDGPALSAAPERHPVVLLPADDTPSRGQVMLDPDHVLHPELLDAGETPRSRFTWSTTTLVMTLPADRLVPVVRATTTLDGLVLYAGAPAPEGHPRVGSLELVVVPEDLLATSWEPTEPPSLVWADGPRMVLSGPGPAWLRADSASPELRQGADDETVVVVGEAEGGRVPVQISAWRSGHGTIWVPEARLHPLPKGSLAPQSIALGKASGLSLLWREGQRACVPRELSITDLTGNATVVQPKHDCTTVATLGHHEATWLVAVPTPLGDALARVDCPSHRVPCLEPHMRPN